MRMVYTTPDEELPECGLLDESSVKLAVPLHLVARSARECMRARDLVGRPGQCNLDRPGRLCRDSHVSGLSSVTRCSHGAGAGNDGRHAFHPQA